MGIEIHYSPTAPTKRFRNGSSNDWAILLRVFADAPDANVIAFGDSQLPELKALAIMYEMGRSPGVGAGEGASIYTEIMNAIVAHGPIRVEARW